MNFSKLKSAAVILRFTSILDGASFTKDWDFKSRRLAYQSWYLVNCSNMLIQWILGETPFHIDRHIYEEKSKLGFSRSMKVITDTLEKNVGLETKLAVSQLPSSP